MKRKFTKIASFVTAACLTLTAVAFAACNPDDTDIPPETPSGSPEKDGYNITVLYPDGSPVKGTDSGDRYARVSAELTDENGERIDPNAKADLNEAGVAQISYNVPGEYYVKLNDIPPGYAFDNTSVKTTVDKAYYTVSIELGAPTPYTVTLIQPDGSPLSGVDVKLMSGSTEVASATTGENGVATTPTIVRGAYKVVLDLPEGLGYRPIMTGIGLTSIYVDLVKLSELPFDEEHLLEGEALESWDNELNWYYPNKENPTMTNLKFDPEADCYAYNVEVGEGEEVFFQITAPKTGAYIIGSKKGNDYEIKFYQNDLSSYDSSLTISSDMNNGNNIQRMRIIEGKQLTVSVKSKTGAAVTVEMLVCIPLPEPEMTIASAPNTYTLNYVEGVKEAIVRFNTAEIGTGVFKLDIETSYNIRVEEVANTGHVLNDDLQLPHTLEIRNSEVGGYTDYHIYILNDDAPATTQIKFTITKTGEARTERTEEINMTAHVSSKFDEQTGTFTWMPTDGSIAPYEKGGLWYVNIGGDEKPLVAAISKNLNVYSPDQVENPDGDDADDSYSFTTLEYFGENGYTPGTQQNTNLTLVTINTSDTEIVTVKTKYNDFINTYAQYSNNDGVYQVTNELKDFLEQFMEGRYADFTGSNNNKPALPWLIACGYYA